MDYQSSSSCKLALIKSLLYTHTQMTVKSFVVVILLTHCSNIVIVQYLPCCLLSANDSSGWCRQLYSRIKLSWICFFMWQKVTLKVEMCIIESVLFQGWCNKFQLFFIMKVFFVSLAQRRDNKRLKHNKRQFKKKLKLLNSGQKMLLHI